MDWGLARDRLGEPPTMANKRETFRGGFRKGQVVRVMTGGDYTNWYGKIMSIERLGPQASVDFGGKETYVLVGRLRSLTAKESGRGK